MQELTPQQQMQQYFEDACTALCISMTLPEVSLLPERDQKSIIAYYMLSVIIQHKNDGWVPNWNSTEFKYYPWFYASYGATAGLGFSNTNLAASTANPTIGSRLCYKSSDLAIEWGNKLLPLYEDYFLLK